MVIGNKLSCGVKSNVTALAAVQTTYKARLGCKYKEATIVHGKYLLLGFCTCWKGSENSQWPL